jgi:hypothetical protein
MPAMSTTIRGTFEVTALFEPPYDTRPGATLGRATFEKVFKGPLTAESHVDMLAARSEMVKDSAGYVAIERIVGSVDGKRGSFVVQHSGTMDHGAQSLTITVVPDSATGELVGLVGTMFIDIIEGQHHYRFEYSFRAQP